MKEDELLDLVLGRHGRTLPDYQEGWIDDPRREIERQGADWAFVRAALRPLALIQRGEVSAAERQVMKLVTESAPWTRVDGHHRAVSRRLYENLARTAQGESIFRTGTAALEHFGYPPSGVERIPAWSASRFAGLGSLWTHPLPGPARRILDLGCGSGADTHIACVVHPGADVLGVDVSTELLSGAAGARRPGMSFLRGSAHALPNLMAAFDLVLANGLPALLGTTGMGPVLDECERVLRPGGELRFTCLVVGGDERIDDLRDVEVFNALRVGKPVIPAVRVALAASGFAVHALHGNASPFVGGFRSAAVRSVTFTAARVSSL